MFAPRPALNNVVVGFDGSLLRVWFHNPVNSGSVWLVAPNGSMRLYDNDVVHAMDWLPDGHADAFPPADPVNAAVAA